MHGAEVMATDLRASMSLVIAGLATGATLGAHLLTPLLRPGYPPQPVDRGWVPFERHRPLDRSEGEMAVTGFVREADRRDWLTPDDDAPGRRFYLFDPRAIGAAMGLPQAPAPFGLVALAPADATKSKGRMRRRR